MTKEQATNLSAPLYEGLQKYYTEKGYTLDSTIKTFEQNGKKISWSIRVNKSDWIHFSPSLSFFNPEINTILKKVFPKEYIISTLRSQGSFLVKVAKEDNPNLDDSTFANYPSQMYYKLDIDGSRDIQKILGNHFSFMEKVGFPYLSNFDSFHSMNIYLNKRIRNFSKEKNQASKKDLQRFYDRREMLSGLVAAHLDNAEDFSEVYQGYYSLFSDNEYVLKSLEDLREGLKK